MILPDLLKPNLNIIFCGTAAGEISAKKKAYYAGPGNQFYPILYRTGLTPNLLNPEQYEELLTHKIGLTDMVKLTSGNNNVIKKRDYDIKNFSKKIFLYQPKIVCFNGKKAAAEFWGKKTKDIDYGLMAETIGETSMFCAPSTSGSARRYWNEGVWYELKSVLKAIKN